MKKSYLIMLLTSATMMLNATEGALSGKFTCNEKGDHVVFAKGNLQYQASTNTWRFADNQYDFVGNEKKGNVFVGETKCSNTQISESYAGWIDMFCYGATGYNAGQNAYQPWATPTSNADILGNSAISVRYVCMKCVGGEYDGLEGWINPADIDTIVRVNPDGEETVTYYIGSSFEIVPVVPEKDTICNIDYMQLTKTFQKSDCGYNPISNGGNKQGLWHTWSFSESQYIREIRPNAQFLRGKAKVDTISGLVLLPDEWTLPEGLTFVPNTVAVENYYTFEQWAKMEEAGAVFLPFAGVRSGAKMYEIGVIGIYGSSYLDGESGLWSMFGNDHSSEAIIGHWVSKKYYALSLRLIQRPAYKLSIPEQQYGSILISEKNTDLNNVPDNTELHIYAIPDDDCYFEGWSNGSTDNPIALTITDNMEIYPIFKQCEQTIVNINEQIYKGESFIVGEHEYTRRGTYRDTLTRANGCDSIVILKLEVLKPLYYSLRVVLNDSTMGTVSGSGDFVPGTEVTITATPINNKYIFVRWYNEDEEIDVYQNPFTFNLNRDLQLRAVFRRKQGKE